MAIQAASLIGSTELSNFVPGYSNRHAQLFTVTNFKIIQNFNEILVRVMWYICDRT